MKLSDSFLLRACLEDSEFFEVLYSSRCPFLFSSKEFFRVFELFKRKKKDYPEFVPRLHDLRELLGSEISFGEEAQERLISQVLEVPEKSLNKFFNKSEKEKDHLLVAHATKVFALWVLQAKQRSPSNFLRAFRDAKSKLPSTFFESADLATFFSGVRERLDASFERVSPFGLKTLDSLCSGGLFPSEAALIIGAKNVGKTFFAVNIAKWNMLMGNLVVFFTLETRKTFVLRRIDSSVFCFKPELYDRLNHQTKESYLRTLLNIQRSMDFLKKITLGEVVVLDYPASVLTPGLIERDLEKVEKQTGRSVDTIIIDYLEIMRGLSGEDNILRLALFETANDLRSICQKRGCSGFVLSQGNRQSRDAMYVDATHSSESWSKPFAFDFVLGLSEDRTNPSKKFVFLADSRRTPKKIAFPCAADFFVSQWREVSD